MYYGSSVSSSICDRSLECSSGAHDMIWNNSFSVADIQSQKDSFQIAVLVPHARAPAETRMGCESRSLGWDVSLRKIIILAGVLISSG